MTRNDATKAAKLIEQQKALYARIKELDSGTITFITCDVQKESDKKEKTSFKVGIEGNKELQALIREHVLEKALIIDERLDEMGIDRDG